MVFLAKETFFTLGLSGTGLSIISVIFLIHNLNRGLSVMADAVLFLLGTSMLIIGGFFYATYEKASIVENSEHPA